MLSLLHIPAAQAAVEGAARRIAVGAGVLGLVLVVLSLEARRRSGRAAEWHFEEEVHRGGRHERRALAVRELVLELPALELAGTVPLRLSAGASRAEGGGEHVGEGGPFTDGEGCACEGRGRQSWLSARDANKHRRRGAGCCEVGARESGGKI